jgi:hypothetical protein
VILGDLSKGEERISSRDQVQMRKVQVCKSKVSVGRSSKSEVLADRSSRSEVPADKSSAYLRCQQTDLV